MINHFQQYWWHSNQYQIWFFKTVQVFVMRKVTGFLVASALLLSMVPLLPLSVANAGERKFFSGIDGKWHGPGQIVAGKYKGTKFTCTLKGQTIQNSIGMDIAGSCRIGVFSQPMSAKIVKSGNSYSGQFLDGEKGEGMDVTGGRFTTSRLVVGIKRKKLDATMVARLDGANKMNVTISVKVQGQLVPVIGMTLAKSTRTSKLD